MVSKINTSDVFSIKIRSCDYIWVEKDIGVVDLDTELWCLYYHNQITAAFEYQDQHIVGEPIWFYLIAPHTSCKASLLSSANQLIHYFSIHTYHRIVEPGIYKVAAADFAIDAINTLTRMSDKERYQNRGQLLSNLVINYSLAALDRQLSSETYQDNRIQASVAHINAFYHQKISIAELAAKQNMTREAFSRLFKQETGETPYRLTTKLRVNKARLLLQAQEYSIGEIAEVIGLKDQYHFSRLFKQWTGESPSVYRKRILGLSS